MRDSPTILSVDRVSTIPLISITVKASPIIVILDTIRRMWCYTKFARWRYRFMHSYVVYVA